MSNIEYNRYHLRILAKIACLEANKILAFKTL